MIQIKAKFMYLQSNNSNVTYRHGLMAQAISRSVEVIIVKEYAHIYLH